MNFFKHLLILIVFSTAVNANTEVIKLNDIIYGNSFEYYDFEYDIKYKVAFRKTGFLYEYWDSTEYGSGETKPDKHHPYVDKNWVINNERVVVEFMDYGAGCFLGCERVFYIDIDLDKGKIIFDFPSSHYEGSSIGKVDYEIARVNGQKFANFKSKFIEPEIQLTNSTNIDKLKLNCKEMGFSENTEAMGNCILKLMEISKGSEISESNSFDLDAYEQQRQTNKILQQQLELEKKKVRQKDLEYYSDQFQKGYDMLYPESEDNSFTCYTNGNVTNCN